MTTATTLYASGFVTIIQVAAFCWLGSFLGSSASFFAGRYLGHTRFVSGFLNRRKVKRVSHRLQRSDTLTVVVFTGKFVGVLRPFYALLLGANRSNVARYLTLEAIASASWSLVWSTVLYFGIDSISQLIGFIRALWE